MTEWTYKINPHGYVSVIHPKGIETHRVCRSPCGWMVVPVCSQGGPSRKRYETAEAAAKAYWGTKVARKVAVLFEDGAR